MTLIYISKKGISKTEGLHIIALVGGDVRYTRYEISEKPNGEYAITSKSSIVDATQSIRERDTLMVDTNSLVLFDRRYGGTLESYCVAIVTKLLDDTSRDILTKKDECIEYLEKYVKLFEDEPIKHKLLSNNTRRRLKNLSTNLVIPKLILDLPEYAFEGVRNIRIISGDRTKFLPDGKDCILTEEGKWANSARQESRAGRVFRKLLDKEKYTTYDMEQFVNALKSKDLPDGEFKIVQGEDIRKYYHYSNYANSYNIGTLEDSCMRYESCQEYFDIYVDHARMLIYVNQEDKIHARAILWTIDGDVYMDRIYGSNVMAVAFTDYAKDQGWFRKLNQNSYDSTWVGKDGGIIDRDLIIEIGKEYTYYPYMDTFQYLLSNGDLTNDCWLNYETELTCTEGGGINDFCQECGSIHRTGDLYYLDSIEAYACKDCVVCDGYGDMQIRSSVVEVSFDGKYYYEDDVMRTEDGRMELIDEVIECMYSGHDYSRVVKDKFVNIFGDLVYEDYVDDYCERHLIERNEHGEFT